MLKFHLCFRVFPGGGAMHRNVAVPQRKSQRCEDKEDR